MRFPTRASFPGALIALALLAGALGPAGALSAQTPRVLRIANAEPTLGTSPLDGSTSASTRVWELMHDGLWDRDENFQPVPWLAASWDTGADATARTLHL